MSGVRDKLLLDAQIAQIGRDGAPGKEQNECKHAQQAPEGDRYGEQQERTDGLQLPFRIEEDHRRAVRRALHAEAVSGVVAGGLSSRKDGVGIRCRLFLGDGRNCGAVHAFLCAVRVIAHEKIAERILHLAGKLPPAVGRQRSRELRPVRRFRRLRTVRFLRRGLSPIFGIQKHLQRVVLLMADAAVIPDVEHEQQYQNDRRKRGHGGADEAPAYLFQHDSSSNA